MTITDEVTRRASPLRNTDAAERLGPYLLHESLGSGGMASVRRATLCGAAGFRREVALKQLHAHLAKDPEIVERFAREARLESQLKHVHVAKTFDFGSIQGVYFKAMELVRGPTLAQLGRQCASAAGPIPLGIVIGLLAQLCDAFDYIHNARDAAGRPLLVSHGDVSPSNIIISNTGLVKLIDFGLSRSASIQHLDATALLRLRLAYVAPEYATGNLDVRSDLFSLGLIAHELVSGQRLLAVGDNGLRRTTEVPRPLRAGPLGEVIMTALEPAPERRWQTAAAMRAALGDLTRDLAIDVGPGQIAKWIMWAFSRRLRPLAPTPLVVEPVVARSLASDTPHREPARLRPRSATPVLRRASAALVRIPTRQPRTPTVTIALPASFSRDVTRRWARGGGMSRRATASPQIPKRRLAAHSIQPDQGPGQRDAGERSDPASMPASNPASMPAPTAPRRTAPAAEAPRPPVALGAGDERVSGPARTARAERTDGAAGSSRSPRGELAASRTQGGLAAIAKKGPIDPSAPAWTDGTAGEVLVPPRRAPAVAAAPRKLPVKRTRATVQGTRVRTSVRTMLGTMLRPSKRKLASLAVALILLALAVIRWL